jgi:hypothetical protein
MSSAIKGVKSELATVPIAGHLPALFSPAGNAFAISLRQKSGVPHRHTHM